MTAFSVLVEKLCTWCILVSSLLFSTSKQSQWFLRKGKWRKDLVIIIWNIASSSTLVNAVSTTLLSCAEQILVFRFQQLGLPVLKGNCVHSSIERTIDVTHNLISLCISFRKQVDLFFPVLAMIHVSVQGLEKTFCKLYQIDKSWSLQRTEGNSLCTKTLWKEVLNKFLSLTRTRHRSVLALFCKQSALLLLAPK